MNLQIAEGIGEFLPQPLNQSASELIVLEF